MSWFGQLRQNQSVEPAQGPPNNDPNNLLVPDPDRSEDEEDIMPTANYDAQHADDEAAGAMEKAVNMLKNFQWQAEDLHFYFAQVEVKMKQSGVKSNFTKLQVLSTILPTKAINSIKNILKKQESEFPQKDAYLQAKTKLLRVFGPCENADFERAMGRVMTDKPSQLAEDLINDLCDKELKNCCCIKVIGGLWRRAMPSAVRQAVAHYDFTRNNLANIMQVADDVFQSTKTPVLQIAAVSAPTTASDSNLSTTEVLNQAFTTQNPNTPQTTEAQIASLAAQVAAMQKSFNNRGGRGGRGRGGRGNGGNRGGGNNSGSQTPKYSAANPRHKTPRHPDLPPFGVCKRHWQFGKSSFTCLEPYTCEWKNFIQPRPQQN